MAMRTFRLVAVPPSARRKARSEGTRDAVGTSVRPAEHEHVVAVASRSSRSSATAPCVGLRQDQQIGRRLRPASDVGMRRSASHHALSLGRDVADRVGVPSAEGGGVGRSRVVDASQAQASRGDEDVGLETRRVAAVRSRRST